MGRQLPLASLRRAFSRITLSDRSEWATTANDPVPSWVWLSHGTRAVRRHRGKSPRQVAFFFRNPELNFQAAQLTSLFVVYGLLHGSDLLLESSYRVGALESGMLLCQVYEAYVEFHAPAVISFEHAWFLLMALARHDELGIARCAVCGGVRLRDLLAKRRLDCGNCQSSECTRPARIPP